MLTQATLTALFGWMLLINLGLYLLAVVAIFALRDWVIATHSRMFGLDPQQIPLQLYLYLARYKLAIIMLNLVPYLALKLL